MVETGGRNEAMESLSQRLIHEYWDFYPTAGSHIGRHEYDGRLPDFTPASLSSRAASIRARLSRVEAIEHVDFQPLFVDLDIPAQPIAEDARAQRENVTHDIREDVAIQCVEYDDHSIFPLLSGSLKQGLT